jgi:hypothetical protein
MLRFGERPQLSKAEFLSLCKEHCTKADYKAVLSAGLNAKDESSLSFMKEFCRFRSMVNAELAYQRSQALKKDEEIYKNRGDKESRISDTVRKAVYNPDPLEGEKIILGLYESFLNDRASGHYFDLDALLIYALRLDVLSRECLFVTEDGNAEFNRLFENLKQDIFRN